MEGIVNYNFIIIEAIQRFRGSKLTQTTIILFLIFILRTNKVTI